MGIERPEQDELKVDVETLGGAATELATLRGLTKWAGDQDTDLHIGNSATFEPAKHLREAHLRGMKIARGVTDMLEDRNSRYIDALATAAKAYGTADRHSAEAVDAVADGMTDAD